MQRLPAGEHWGTGDEEYPFAAFLCGEQGVNLCFEEREGVEGLHTYYDERLRRERDCQRLELSLRLLPIELQRLFRPDGLHPSLRTTFRFEINGERALYRLERVVRYGANEPSTECSFIRINRDAL